MHLASTRHIRHFMILFSLFTFAVPILAQDWTRWRGPNGDGTLTGFIEPAAWPAALKQRWKVNVGEAHSSPVIAGGRVYQLSRQGDNEIVRALELSSGKQLWIDSYPVNYKLGLSGSVAVGKHKQYPRSSPLLQNGKLYTVGIGGTLSCYDTATGKLAWRRDFRDQFKDTAPGFGASASPIIDRGLLILHCGNDDNGALIAMDANTGATKWQWNGDGPGYATPIVATFMGTRQIITHSAHHIIAIWPENGGLLWKIPFTTSYTQNSITPVVYKDTLILSGLDKGIFAVRPKYQNGQWAADQVWRNDEISLYMSSPILSGNQLYGLSHKNKGQFFCMDAGTGKLMWRGQPRQAENAALVIGGNVMFWLNNDAELIAVRVNGGNYEEIKRYKVADSETWAHPAISGKQIVIKDYSSLTLWSLE
ncbi:MAG: PQQ-binding-like beta-propeller repeat protein [Blastocatellia bacterium]